MCFILRLDFAEPGMTRVGKGPTRFLTAAFCSTCSSVHALHVFGCATAVLNVDKQKKSLLADLPNREERRLGCSQIAEVRLPHCLAKRQRAHPNPTLSVVWRSFFPTRRQCGFRSNSAELR